jgi:NADH-quinone oxidoreductase subunit L
MAFEKARQVKTRSRTKPPSRSICMIKNPTMLSHETEWMLMAIAVAGALIMILVTYILYIRNKMLPAAEESELKPLQRLIYNKYYVDEIYDNLFRKPLDSLSKFFYKIMDLQVVDSIVNGVGSTVRAIGTSVRYFQTGNIGFYIMSMAMGVVLIVLLTFLIK